MLSKKYVFLRIPHMIFIEVHVIISMFDISLINKIVLTYIVSHEFRIKM